MRKLAALLIIISVLLMSIHSIFLKNQKGRGEESYLISIDASYVVAQPNTVISIQPPYESKHIRLVQRSINHTGLRIAAAPRNAMTKREIRLRAHKPGRYTFGAEFVLQLNQAPNYHRASENALSSKTREFFLAHHEWYLLDNSRLEAKLIELGLNTTDHETLLENIFNYVLKLANNKPASFNSAAKILELKKANTRERSLLMVALSRKAGIPARIVTGLELTDDPVASPVYWVEVYAVDRWLSYHPGLGYRHSLPVNYVAFDKFGGGIVSGLIPSENITRTGSTRTDYIQNIEISVERVSDSMISPDNTRSEWYQVFMLDRLPSDTREQLSLLMLLPLAALLCSLIRQLVGLHSYGVFTPAILALAVTYADRETTLLILAITLVLVYLGRPTFHQQMSRTPRLSIIFTLVAFSMVIGVSILDYFAAGIDGHLILLPIVIITSLIDRFFSAIELHGYHTAFIRLFWTAVLTVISLPILQQDWLGTLILRYPESHLITLALLILVSSYPFGKYRLPAWLGLLAEPEKKTVIKKNKKRELS